MQRGGVYALAVVMFACAPSSQHASDAALVDAAVDAAIPTASFAIADYSGGNGKFLLLPISIDNGPLVNVLLDTGSSGLRIFASALTGQSVITDSPVTSIQFGGGDVFTGPTANAVVSIGGVATPDPIAFQLVNSVSCVSTKPACGSASGMPTSYTDNGIFGILGASLRADTPAAIYSPFAQLAKPLGDGFVISAGTFGATQGELAFGPVPSTDAGFVYLQLATDTRRSVGAPAWKDTPQICFKIDGAATDPPCGAANFDTGGNLALVYQTALPSTKVDSSGFLLPGVTFEAYKSPFDFQLTIGDPPTTSLDTVRIQTTSVGYVNLSIEPFFRFDVAYDIAQGRIGFRAR